MNSIQPNSESVQVDSKPLMTIREVALKMGIPTSTAHYLEQSALRKIRRYLENRGYGASQ